MHQVTDAACVNPVLSALLLELQRLWGGALSPRETSHFAGLFLQNNFDADLILTASLEAINNNAKAPAYVEKILFSWREANINNVADADKYLQLLALRQTREKTLAQDMGLKWDPFTLADKKKISLWFEEYNFDLPMIQAARIAAGQRSKDVKYLAGILKKWFACGYTSPKDLQHSDEGRNIRASRATGGEDILANTIGYTPIKRRGQP